MLSMTGWMIALMASVCAILLAAGANRPDLHMIACGVIGLLITLHAIRERANLIDAGAAKNKIAASTARNLGLVWCWGALGILATYTLILEQRWPEWWQFFLGFALAGVGSLAFANTVARDEEKGRVDESILQIGRYLVWAQVIAVAAALVSMFFDGKFPRAASYPDWMGCNIFFFGGLALIAISINALRISR